RDIHAFYPTVREACPAIRTRARANGDYIVQAERRRIAWHAIDIAAIISAGRNHQYSRGACAGDGIVKTLRITCRTPAGIDDMGAVANRIVDGAYRVRS